MCVMLWIMITGCEVMIILINVGMICSFYISVCIYVYLPIFNVYTRYWLLLKATSVDVYIEKYIWEYKNK